MLARRNSLKQIIAVAAAPAIIPVAHLMRINSTLAAPRFYRLCKFRGPEHGLLMSVLRSSSDRGWLLVARNTTTAPFITGGIRLIGGEERVVCTSHDLRRYALGTPPSLI